MCQCLIKMVSSYTALGPKVLLKDNFLSPYGIALSPNGSIYISDCYNKRIQTFSDY